MRLYLLDTFYFLLLRVMRHQLHQFPPHESFHGSRIWDDSGIAPGTYNGTDGLRDPMVHSCPSFPCYRIKRLHCQASGTTRSKYLHWRCVLLSLCYGRLAAPSSWLSRGGNACSPLLGRACTRASTRGKAEMIGTYCRVSLGIFLGCKIVKAECTEALIPVSP